MKKFWLLCCLFLSLGFACRAQTTSSDSLSTGADSLLTDLLADSSVTRQELLPRKMLFTQRAFWGPQGLLRVTNIAPLTAEGRERELKVRRTMLATHQVLGFVTLAGFVAQGIVGSRLYNAKGLDYVRLVETHRTLATGINISYTTTAVLSLVTPPKLLAERKGLSSIKLHKYLAMVHIAGMITTNVLSQRQKSNPDLKPYHRAAAFTTFGAYALSIIALKF